MKKNEKLMDVQTGVIHLTEAPWRTWCGKLTITVVRRYEVAEDGVVVDCQECIKASNKWKGIVDKASTGTDL